ncbi:MAG: ComEC/Rec2 family competence protein [Anaerolineaceae bacterium]|nr:ComEC/Rec2 family competence protein [Anaerolineaceae bacterium]
MPLLWLSVGFAAGIVLASQWTLPWPLWAALAAFALVLGFLELYLPLLSRWHKHFLRVAPLPAGFLLAVLLLGAARFQASRPVITQGALAFYNGQGEVRFTAVVVEPPRKLESITRLRLRAEQMVQVEGTAISRPVEGLALATLPADSSWQYGDRLELTGKLTDPFEGESFSYRDYLARQGVYSVITFPRIRRLEQGAGNFLLSGIYAFRGQAYRVLNQLFPQPEAALLSGILLGMEDDLPPALARAFRDTGTTHIIAISGFNIAILAALFSSLAGRVIRSRWLALLAAVLGITFYTVLVGAGASVVRAAIMGSISLLGRQIGRRNAGLHALSLTAACMCVFNPNLLWDVGFQLSFSATLGLVWFGAPLESMARDWLKARFSPGAARRLTGPLSEYFLFTLAAQVTTLPVLLYHFQRLSLSSFFANPLVLPPQPFVMTVGGASVLAGMVLFPLGKALSFLVWPLLAYTIKVTEALAKIHSGALVVGQATALWAAVYFLAMFLLSRNLSRLWQKRTLIKPYAGFGIFFLGSLLVWRGFFSAPDGRLHLTAFSGKDGPALQVQTAEGRGLFIQYGAPTRVLNTFLARRLPVFHQRPDGLILPDDAASALMGLPDFLDRFPPDWILWNTQTTSSRSASRLRKWAQTQETPLLPLQPGQSILLGRSATLEVLVMQEKETLLGLASEGFRAILASGSTPEHVAGLPPAWSSPGIALVLSEDSFKEFPPQDWLALRPAMVIAPTGAPGLPPTWLALDQRAWVEVVAGEGSLWILTGK